MASFHIRIDGDDLGFAAGHFITLSDGSCERLHGHTYCVAVEVFGSLNSNGYVVDFVAVRAALKGILGELDHRMLLPMEHPSIRVASRKGEVEVTFGKRRWVFPEDDCLLLPIANTTTELLAEHIGRLFLANWALLGAGVLDRVDIEIGEGSGAKAVCTLP